MAFEFRYKRRVEFAETDMAGVLHFASYYRLMEEVEHAFWRSAGLSVMTNDDGRDIGWPRVKTNCQYFRPARFEDELELALRVVKIGDRSVEYEIEFRCEGERVALGHTTAVCCTMGAGVFGSLPIPDRLRVALEQAPKTENERPKP